MPPQLLTNFEIQKNEPIIIKINLDSMDFIPEIICLKKI